MTIHRKSRILLPSLPEPDSRYEIQLITLWHHCQVWYPFSEYSGFLPISTDMLLMAET